MNEISKKFLMSLAEKPMLAENAYSMFGGKFEFENQQSRHFSDKITFTPDYKCFTLTLDGRDYVESQDALRKRQQELEEQRKADEAKDVRNRKQQFRHDWRIAIISVLAGSVLTLIFEHIQEILTALREMVSH